MVGGAWKYMFKYAEMREILDKNIPEILTMGEYSEMKELWLDEEIPMYCYYESLEHLFLKLLKREIVNVELLNRILDFMEEMANSEDVDVQNLLQVQILEGLCGLDYETFHIMETELFRPSTKELFNYTRQFFEEPLPSSER